MYVDYQSKLPLCTLDAREAWVRVFTSDLPCYLSQSYARLKKRQHEMEINTAASLERTSNLVFGYYRFCGCAERFLKLVERDSRIFCSWSVTDAWDKALQKAEQKIKNTTPVALKVERNIYCFNPLFLQERKGLLYFILIFCPSRIRSGFTPGFNFFNCAVVKPCFCAIRLNKSPDLMV